MLGIYFIKALKMIYYTTYVCLENLKIRTNEPQFLAHLYVYNYQNNLLFLKLVQFNFRSTHKMTMEQSWVTGQQSLMGGLHLPSGLAA